MRTQQIYTISYKLLLQLAEKQYRLNK